MGFELELDRGELGVDRVGVACDVKRVESGEVDENRALWGVAKRHEAFAARRLAEEFEPQVLDLRLIRVWEES